MPNLDGWHATLHEHIPNGFNANGFTNRISDMICTCTTTSPIAPRTRLKQSKGQLTLTENGYLPRRARKLTTAGPTNLTPHCHYRKTAPSGEKYPGDDTLYHPHMNEHLVLPIPHAKTPPGSRKGVPQGRISPPEDDGQPHAQHQNRGTPKPAWDSLLETRQ